jgi:hypothetical protein
MQLIISNVASYNYLIVVDASSTLSVYALECSTVSISPFKLCITLAEDDICTLAFLHPPPSKPKD